MTYRLQERYALMRVVGRGGMAHVWAARDLAEGRRVAVKTVDMAPDPRRLEQLRTEARVTAAVEHPGVVDVEHVGVHEDTAFLVMELLPGRDLAALLREGTLPLRTSLRVAGRVAEALQATHRSGVVHCDVKPANVVVGPDRTTLIDFGIAATDRAPGRLTRGTAQYMAPEQVSAGPVTPAADMYAFGCLLTALVAGRPPFSGSEPMEVLRHHVHSSAPRLADRAPRVPTVLDELVAALLAKEPAARPTAREALATVEGLRSGELTQPPLRTVRQQRAPAGAGLAVVRARPAAPAPDPEATAPMVSTPDSLDDDLPQAA